MRNTITRIRTRAHAPTILATLMSVALGLGLAACSKEKKNDAAKDTPKTKPTTPTTDKAGSEPVKTPETGENSLAGAAGSYTVDPGHSTVIFGVSHFGYSRVYGRFNKVDGSFTLDADPAKSSISLEIDASSVFTALKKRDDHLKSPDFFNVQQFPTITFKSTAVKSLGDNKYEVTGDLTLHGVTKPVTATMEHIGAGVSPADNQTFLTGFEGEFEFKRSDFDMKYMEGALGDDIRVIVAIEGARQ